MTHSILYTQREQTKRSTRQSCPPVAPHRRFTYTQSIQTNKQKRISSHQVSIFWEREPQKWGGEALKQSEAWKILCTAIKLTCYYNKKFNQNNTPHNLAGTGKHARMQLEREREQPYAITPFWVFTLALFLSLCTKWLAKPDHFAAYWTFSYCESFATQ